MPLDNVLKAQHIANACIHEERAIGCKKELFQILDREISLPLAVAGSVNQVLAVCYILSNVPGLETSSMILANKWWQDESLDVSTRNFHNHD